MLRSYSYSYSCSYSNGFRVRVGVGVGVGVGDWLRLPRQRRIHAPGLSIRRHEGDVAGVVDGEHRAAPELEVALLRQESAGIQRGEPGHVRQLALHVLRDRDRRGERSVRAQLEADEAP